MGRPVPASDAGFGFNSAEKFRIAECEIGQCSILGNPARLFPDCLAGWWTDASNNNVACLTFGMTTNVVYRFFATHSDSA